MSLCAEGFHSFMCACKLSALTEYVSFPAFFNHSPVCLVTVHSNDHPSAARSYFAVKPTVSERRKEVLKRINILQSGSLAHIAAVKKNMNSHTADAVLLGMSYKGFEMIYMGMNVAVGEKSEKMQSAAAALYIVDFLFPCFRLKDLAGLNGIGYKLRALSKHLTGAESVMADL